MTDFIDQECTFSDLYMIFKLEIIQNCIPTIALFSQRTTFFYYNLVYDFKILHLLKFSIKQKSAIQIRSLCI